MTSPLSNWHQEALALAGSLPPLMVASRQAATAVLPGPHGRRRTGQGGSFWQFRRAQPGDPANAIDWRQSAKGAHLYLRETEWTAAHSIWLWVDATGSMRWGSSPQHATKHDRAAVLGLALASLLLRGGERVAWLAADRAPLFGQTALPRLAAELAAGQDEPLPERDLPRNAQLVLLSDFLMDLAQLERQVRHWRDRGHTGHLLQIVDPAEEVLPYQGRVQFVGLEGEGPLLVSEAGSLRHDYARCVAEHRAGLVSIARAAGWSFAVHHTDQSASPALLGLYAALAQP